MKTKVKYKDAYFNIDKNFKDKINKYNKTIIIPEINNKNKVETEKKDLLYIIKTISHIEIISSTLDIDKVITYDKLYKDKTDLKDKLKKTIIYDIYPSEEQKKILFCWFDLYIDMYNKVLEKIKKSRKSETEKHKKLIKYNELDIDLDLNALKKEFTYYKKELSEKKINNEKNKVNMHILDYAIKDALTSFKSIQSNLNNGHIKKTRLRYIKKNKDTKILKIEKQICQQKSFCSSVLGKTIKIIPEIEFNQIKEVAILQYSKKTNKFKFFVKEEEQIKQDNRNNIIALDPGSRTLLTGVSNDHIVEIGVEPLKSIKPLIKKIEQIKKGKNKKNKKIKNKKKALLKAEAKIKNRTIDIHNKAIRYLLDNYKNILIGNMSTKSIVESKQTNKNLKKEMNAIKIYQLREKLKIKCIKEDKKYKLINEYKTSKTCSNCGNEKKDLGPNKIYNCEKCKKIYDRDINASKNILLKGIK